MAEGPVVVCGPQRSGTSLLRACLDSHPGVRMAPEIFFFNSIAPRCGDPGAADTPRRIARFVDDEAWWIPADTFDLDRFVGLPAEPRDRWPDHYARLLGCLAGLDPSRHRWVGEKSPANLFSVDDILRTLSGSRVLLTRRDPRAIVSSSLKAGINGGSLAAAIDTTRRSCLAADELLERHAGDRRVLGIDYDELVTEPERILRGVCEVVGLDFDPAMLAPERRSEAGFDPATHPHHLATLSPIGSASVTSWKAELPRWQAVTVSRSFGLDLEPPPTRMEEIAASVTGRLVEVSVPFSLLRRRLAAAGRRWRAVHGRP